MPVQLHVDAITFQSDPGEQVPEQDGRRERREVVAAAVDEQHVPREEAPRKRDLVVAALGNVGEKGRSRVDEVRRTAGEHNAFCRERPSPCPFSSTLFETAAA